MNERTETARGQRRPFSEELPVEDGIRPDPFDVLTDVPATILDIAERIQTHITAAGSAFAEMHELIGEAAKAAYLKTRAEVAADDVRAVWSTLRINSDVAAVL